MNVPFGASRRARNADQGTREWGGYSGYIAIRKATDGRSLGLLGPSRSPSASAVGPLLPRLGEHYRGEGHGRGREKKPS